MTLNDNRVIYVTFWMVAQLSRPDHNVAGDSKEVRSMMSLGNEEEAKDLDGAFLQHELKS
jgi:hypothetical protein